MEKPIIQRRTIKSISEWSVFKIALVAYLIIFVLTVIVFGIIALITWAGFAASGINLNSLFASTGIGSLLSGFGVTLPNLNIALGTGGVVGIVLFIVFGLLFSVVYAAVATFWTWIINVIIKISGGLEVRYIDKTITAGSKIPENTAANS
ncbi:MAG: DUF3566 domain-containing protein [Actinobacteria bacterium]|nr:DUF3566 domain-containing protein [Actinomycetota bacterium]